MNKNNWENVTTVKVSKSMSPKSMSPKRLSPKSSMNIDLPIFSLFEDYVSRPSVYFLNLLEQLTMIDRGYTPVAFLIIHNNGSTKHISKEEFIKEARRQYGFYIKTGEGFRELESRYPHITKLSKSYPLATREMYERQAHNRRKAALIARSTRKRSAIAKAGTKRRLNNITKNSRK